MTVSELLDAIEIARRDLRRAEQDYSVCILTDSLCRAEQTNLERARKRLATLEHKLRQAQARKNES